MIKAHSRHVVLICVSLCLCLCLCVCGVCVCVVVPIMASGRARLSMQEIQSFRKYFSVHHFSLTLILMYTILNCGEQNTKSPKCLSLAKSWEQENGPRFWVCPQVWPQANSLCSLSSKEQWPMCVVVRVLHIFQYVYRDTRGNIRP